MPFMSSDFSTFQDAQLPRQAYMPINATYDNSSYPAASEVQQGQGSTDNDLAAWLPDATDTKQADLMEIPLPSSSTNAVQRTTTKRAPGGEITRPKGRRLPHNLIERRYRDNLNRQIEVLRDELPTFKSIVAYTADIEDTTTSLGAVLEQERGQATTRNTLLCEQVEGLQKLVRCDDCAIVKYLEGMQPRMVTGH
ncbi:hypothetical protein LTR78_010659 [Recurvomyces mirabilis]|uniref:BHLH domain-containing protein n=1 Tax=Recurvomyces mirabilis TaxID=574656 RepID=A0AAE0WI58_9PEZI|nr:hypothetical protein LTR78_010659 [Recurvomyces mirabilis]KAK5149744.1 hypothetical protein LTS14_010665 [Recurvomyces mirabilis]